MPPDFGEADREIRQLGDFKGELCSALMHEQFAAFILAGIKFRELDQSCTPLPLTFDITGAAQLHRAASVLMDGLAISKRHENISPPDNSCFLKVRIVV